MYHGTSRRCGAVVFPERGRVLMGHRLRSHIDHMQSVTSLVNISVQYVAQLQCNSADVSAVFVLALPRESCYGNDQLGYNLPRVYYQLS